MVSPFEQTLLDAQAKDWLARKVVERTKEALWSNNLVFVAKKDGRTRVCVDCRPANLVTKDFEWPLPRLQDLRHHLRGARWFSRIDLKDAFFRIGIPEEWRYLTAFNWRGKTYQFRKMPFGLKTAPSTFQRFMDFHLKPVQDICYWYIDDVLVYGPTREKLRRNVARVTEQIRQSGSHINYDKSLFDQTGLLFGGLWVYHSGQGPNFGKLQELFQQEPPRTKKEKQSALGLVSYLRDFIPLVAHYTAELFPGKGQQLEPTQYQEEWKRLLKHIARAISSLSQWSETEDADLFTDASGQAVAAVLIQNGRIIAVASRKLQGAETRYSTTDREHLSLVLAAKRMRIFMHRPKGVTRVRNDHAALINRRVDEMTPRQTRWYQTIETWVPNLQHVKGELNAADYFSRWPLEIIGGQVSV